MTSSEWNSNFPTAPHIYEQMDLLMSNVTRKTRTAKYKDEEWKTYSKILSPPTMR